MAMAIDTKLGRVMTYWLAFQKYFVYKSTVKWATFFSNSFSYSWNIEIAIDVSVKIYSKCLTNFWVFCTFLFQTWNEVKWYRRQMLIRYIFVEVTYTSLWFLSEFISYVVIFFLIWYLIWFFNVNLTWLAEIKSIQLGKHKYLKKHCQ